MNKSSSFDKVASSEQETKASWIRYLSLSGAFSPLPSFLEVKVQHLDKIMLELEILHK